MIGYQPLSDCKAHNRLNKAETTVAQKLNRTSSPKTGCIRFRVCFLGSFLHKQKRTVIN